MIDASLRAWRSCRESSRAVFEIHHLALCAHLVTCLSFSAYASPVPEPTKGRSVRSGGNVLTTLSCSASGIFAICCDLTRSTITRVARTFRSTRTRRRREPYIPLVAFCQRHFLADFIICMCEFDVRRHTAHTCIKAVARPFCQAWKCVLDGLSEIVHPTLLIFCLPLVFA